MFDNAWRKWLNDSSRAANPRRRRARRARPTPRLTVEVLENRLVPTVYAVTAGNVLLQFDELTPGVLTDSNPIVGLQGGESVVGIDFRPATGQLYALGDTSRLYTLDPATGQASEVGSGPFTPALSGAAFGFDFNPVVDRIRVVSDTGQNLRLNPDNGAVAGTDTTLNQTNVVASAYTNNFSGATATTLFGINSGSDMLVRQGNPSPNDGMIFNIGFLDPVGMSDVTTSAVGFDIDSSTGLAFASLTAPAATTSALHTIDLSTGAAVLVGTIGGGDVITGLAIAPAVVAFSAPTFTVAEGDGTATITVTRTGDTSDPQTVDFAVADGTATAPDDYTLTSGTLTFLAGETSQTFDVAIIDDVLDEADETVSLTLSNPLGGAVLGAQRTATLTITDNDTPPALSIADTSVTEGDSGTVNAVFSVTLSAASSLPITVDFATADGTATDPSDYAATSGSFSFAPGTTAQSITVLVNGDLVDEPDEVFTVNLANAANATIDDGSADGTILTDDPQPTVDIADVTRAEGNVGGSDSVFTVTLSNPSSFTVTVDFTTNDASATTADNDYLATSGTLTFAPGETEQAVTVSVTGDTKFEDDEVFSVDLSGATNALPGDINATGTIQNDDPQPTLNVADAAVAEGDGGTTNLVFTLSLTNASEQPVTAAFATADGTATAGSDYTPALGVATFAPGATQQTVTVAVTGDTTFELDETFTLNVTGVTNALNGDLSGTGTILNDDPQPQLSGADVTADEPDTGTADFVFTVTLSNASSATATVDFATAAGTATEGTDFTGTSGTLTFAPGSTSQLLTVSVIGDTTAEDDETFTVTLSNPTGATIADDTLIGTITDNDPAPSLSIGDVTVAEGDAGTVNAVFSVTLSAASGQTVSVDFTTADGTATQPADYAASSGTLTFAPGTTSQSVTVAVAGDLVDEADETFSMGLSNPVNATVADGTGTGTITDNDPAPSLSITDVTASEGNSGTTPFVFAVTLSAASGQTVTVAVATADGTATQPADYAAVSTTLTFAPGTTTQQVTVQVVGDTLDEADETFTVNLSGATNATIADAAGTGTISDDDQTPSLSISDATVAEGNSGTVGIVFSVSLSGVSGLTVTVDFSTADGTASSPADYTAASGTLTFAPGTTTQLVTVSVVGDTLDEPNETFNVNLANPVNATIADGSGLGTITDDDESAGTVQLGAATFSGTEGAGAAVGVVITRTGGMAAFEVTLTPTSGTAQAGSDFVATPITVSFAASETSRTVNLPLVDDSVLEPHGETFTVTLSNPTNGGTLGTPSSATVSLRDDDGTPSQRFVAEAFRDLLGREPDAGGLAFFTNQLDSGQTDRFGVALGIQNSGFEYRTNLVRNLYRQILRREADPAGELAFVQFLLAGGTVDQVKAFMFGSDEYFQTRGGGTNQGFLNALFPDTVGRPIDMATQTTFQQLLDQGFSRTQLALSILNTQEADQFAAGNLYLSLLNRAADTAGLAGATSALQQGLRDEILAATIVASDEYFINA